MAVSDRAFLGIAALLFAGSAAVTVAWCGAMSTMGGMPMAGGWTMSMAWMRMCEQSWLGAAASFIGMWTVMMVAMMLPPLIPMLQRHRRALAEAGVERLGRPTALVGAGYFCVWTLVGAAVYPPGIALASAGMQLPGLSGAVPILAGAVVLIAGIFQFTGWKARYLACCRASAGSAGDLSANARAAWRHGLRLGLYCVRACAGPTAVLLAVGVMDLHAMAVVGAAIGAERLAPSGALVARATGAVAIGAGGFLMAQAIGIA